MKVTMADVARAAGVSSALVSLAFRDAYGVSKPTRERILATAESMGYQPNRMASRLASKVDDTLGVFLLDLHNEVFADMFDGMRDSAHQSGRELVLTVGSISGDLDRPALDSLVRARVDVAIAAGLLLSDAELQAFRGRLRLVSVARVVPGFDAVASDNVLGATMAVEHLLELGHRRIVHLASPPTDGYLGRREGYTASMARAGLTPHLVTCGYSRQEASDLAGPLLDAPDRPTAIFTHNDQTALGVLDAVHARGLRVPEDITVVGYDNTSASKLPGVDLTTVDLHPVDLGRRAAEIAVLRSNNPALEPMVEVLSPSLLVRASSAPPLP
ncbi:LacI family DNA-binding transcriptional regulator [Arthrobacter sp. M4]|uniref:LacI family DNA-binding transcriptional regulator n=1 Tax=Arthrobacter sp. M4 TaxID=218160 RepID=UPI001CDCB2FD|nr:LacI family DNA-binding transcriptional regulator [Arthrobacter sp. M4]MCA4134804.1 LacI family transcriptional regulator [Arthrobacter sp. M4]